MAEASNGSATWQSLRLCKTAETSNDLTFANIDRHTLAVELSGTVKHLTVMDGHTHDAATHVDDICQLPAGLAARFAWQTIGSRQESLILEFDSDMFTRFCPEFVSGSFFAGHLVPRNYEQNPELASLIRLLSRELCCLRKRGRLFAESVIRLLAIEIAHSSWSRRPLSCLSANVANTKIRAAVDYIECHFAGEISLTDLTQASGLNSTHLINSFKKLTGVTPYNHVLNRRIQQAVHLLKTTETPIVHVALEAGFSDQQQMTNAFRVRLGRTPRSFRENQSR